MVSHFAAQGIIKPDIWGARRTSAQLKVKIEVPVSGTSIDIL